MVQGLRLGTLTVIGIGSIPDWRTKMSNTAWYGQKINSNKIKKNEIERGVRWSGIIHLEPYLFQIGRYVKKLLLSKGRVH